MQGSLPAGWLAFTGRELNPLDRDEGFQITSSSLPGLFLAQRPKTLYERELVKAFPRAHRGHILLFEPLQSPSFRPDPQSLKAVARRAGQEWPSR
jgi:hypothetical protein